MFVSISQHGTAHGYEPGEIDEARAWLIQAGERNNWKAAQVLALCYEKGCWGLPVDIDRSNHYKKIAEKFRTAARVSATSGTIPVPVTIVQTPENAVSADAGVAP